MNITEVIAKLTELRILHGDLEVWVHDGMDPSDRAACRTVYCGKPWYGPERETKKIIIIDI